MKKIYLLLAVAFLSVGCQTLNQGADSEGGLNLTDPSQPIEVQAGESFEIVIASNPSTGYHWEIVGDLTSVEFVSLDYKADEPVLAGSGGVDVWTFKALSAGKTQIILGSYPPGVTVSDGEPEQTVIFNIDVK